MTPECVRHHPSVMEALSRNAKAVAKMLQKPLRIRPKHFCLISGAPRSGTTAVGSWLCDCHGVAGFMESRILVAVHRFIQEIHRFEDLDCCQEKLIPLARRLVYGYYADHAVLFRKTLLLDKEPLEPIAFPDKHYTAFLENIRAVLPETKLLLMVRHPVASVSSMSQRKWGYSLTDTPPQELSLEEHVETWCSSVESILKYADDPNTYICQFGRLVSEPEKESKQICDFLEIPASNLFRPRPTHSVELAHKEAEFVLSRSKRHLEMLRECGITDLE